MPKKKPGALHYGDKLPEGAMRRLGTTRFWHLPFEGGNPGTNDMAFSPDGRMLAALGYQDNELSIFAVPSGRLIRRWREGRVDGGGKLLFSPSGKSLAVACDDGLRLRNPQTGRQVRAFLQDSCAVSGIAFSSDGKLFAAAEPWDGRIEIWQVSTGKLLHCFEADLHPVLADDRCELRSDEFYCVAFSPDGQLVAAGSRHFIYHYARGAKADKLEREISEKTRATGLRRYGLGTCTRAGRYWNRRLWTSRSRRWSFRPMVEAWRRGPGIRRL